MEHCCLFLVCVASGNWIQDSKVIFPARVKGQVSRIVVYPAFRLVPAIQVQTTESHLCLNGEFLRCLFDIFKVDRPFTCRGSRSPLTAFRLCCRVSVASRPLLGQGIAFVNILVPCWAFPFCHSDARHFSTETNLHWDAEL